MRHGRHKAQSTKRKARLGMTLFEVVLAMTIFGGAWVALSQLYSTGTRASVQARHEADAVIHAQSKMAELVAGLLPLDSMTDQSFDDPDLAAWSWSTTVGPGPHVDLLAVEVTVRRNGSNSMARVSYSLRRYVRDPQLFLDAAMQAAATTSEQ